MGRIDAITRGRIEDYRRNSLFINTDLHHLDGEHIQMLREHDVDTESDSRREVQVIVEGEGETRQEQIESGDLIENLPELKHSEDTFVHIDTLTGVIIDELQSDLEAK
jgi:hypothetical protein